MKNLELYNFNPKIKELKSSKLFSSLEETVLNFDKVGRITDLDFVADKDDKLCQNSKTIRTQFGSQENPYLSCMAHRGRRQKKILTLNSVNQLLDSLFAIDADYAKTVNKLESTVNKLESDAKKLKGQNESLTIVNEKQAKELDELNSKTDQKCNDTATEDKGGGGKKGSEGSGSKTIFTGLIDIISKAGMDSDIITGSWSSKRNKKGVFKTKFMLDDVAGAINLKGKTDSILGDSENTRTVGSGSLKMDYYSDGKMIAEVSVLKKY